jgi:hypothetical protein
LIRFNFNHVEEHDKVRKIPFWGWARINTQHEYKLYIYIHIISSIFQFECFNRAIANIWLQLLSQQTNKYQTSKLKSTSVKDPWAIRKLWPTVGLSGKKVTSKSAGLSSFSPLNLPYIGGTPAFQTHPVGSCCLSHYDIPVFPTT